MRKQRRCSLLSRTSDDTVRQKQTKVLVQGMWVLVICCAVVFGLLVVLIVAQVNVRAVSTSAQEDATQLLSKLNETPAEEVNPRSAVSMTTLLGQPRDAAFSTIRHGATLDREFAIDESGLVTEVDVVLADEWVDAQSGTPTVVLKLDAASVVRSVTYRTPISLLGYNTVSFSDAVSHAHMIEKVLDACGVSGVGIGSIQLPARSEFSTYEADRTTLASENYTFRGEGVVGELPCTWSVTLLYDYTQANASGNLVDTTRTIAITVTAR